jgi:hypothetical protein
MADTFVTIDDSTGITATVQQTSLFTASTNLANPATVDSLGSVGDVDTTTNGKLNGSVLVYKTTTNRWTSTTTLDAQNMEGGEF